MAVRAKKERIDIRISKEDKEFLNFAAEIKNLSVSDYLLKVGLKAAELDIKDHEVLKLQKEASMQILNALENPPKPNDELVALFK